MAKEAYYVAKETYSYSKRGLTTLTTSAYLRRCLAPAVLLPAVAPQLHRILQKPQGGCEKRPIYMEKEACYVARETYSYGKRGLFVWQKRPIM